jgi:uncharacterized protein (TIGR01777 family)
MTLGVTGASGFIGRAVCALAARRGHRVVRFSRTPGGDARQFVTDSLPDLSGLDAVIHLAGESLLGRWTAAKKNRIRASRIEGTRRIVEAMAGSVGGPRTLVSASAIGFYGETGDRVVDEEAASGSGFLAEICRAWEAEARRAEAHGIRVARVRVGLVLGRGGALALMRPAFLLGLGGRLGSGRQWMSAIHVDDAAGVFLRITENPLARGAFNAVMPESFCQAAFTREVARTLRRPAVCAVPAFVLRLVLGELSSLLLGSQRVQPRRTLEAGCVFRFATLSAALQDTLKR